MGGCASNHCFSALLGNYYEPPAPLEAPDGEAARRARGGSGTGLYVAVPSAADPAGVDRDARLVLRALSGVGTDDAALARLVSSRTPAQLRAAKRAFEERYGRGETLEEWLADDTSGLWARTLLLAVTDGAERDADMLHRAFSAEGFRDPDTEVRHVLGTSSHRHLREVEAAYYRERGATLAAALRRHTRRDNLARQLMLAALEKADYLARRLRDAFRGAGPPEERAGAVMRLLAGVPRDSTRRRQWLARFEDHLNTGLVAELEEELSTPDLRDVKEAYRRMFGEAVEDEVERHAGGNAAYREALLSLCAEPAAQLAAGLFRALHAQPADHDLLVELVATKPPGEVRAAARAYDHRYGEPLADAAARLAAPQGGARYAAALATLLEPPEDTLARHLHEVYGGGEASAGPEAVEADTVVALLLRRGRRQVADVARAYRRLYGEPLESLAEGGATHADRWNRRMLAQVLRGSSAGLLHVPRSHLLRVRDL